MTRRAHALLIAALTACPGRVTTTDATESSSSTGTSGPGTSSTGAPTTGADTTGATTGGTSGSTGGTTGAANPCDMCPADTLCVQGYDGFCNSSDVTCMPNPDGCVPPAPGEMCSPACAAFCSICSSAEMCGDEVPGALHCYGI